MAGSQDQRFVGYVKSVGDNYGFIDCGETRDMYGRDVHLAVGEYPPDIVIGTRISFSITLSERGRPQALMAKVEEDEESVNIEESPGREKESDDVLTSDASAQQANACDLSSSGDGGHIGGDGGHIAGLPLESLPYFDRTPSSSGQSTPVEHGVSTGRSTPAMLTSALVAATQHWSDVKDDLEMGLEEALRANGADQFVFSIEVELRRLLAAPQGTVLRMPLIATPYVTLLRCSCNRFGMVHAEVYHEGSSEINVSTNSATWQMNNGGGGGNILAPCPGLRIPVSFDVSPYISNTLTSSPLPVDALRAHEFAAGGLTGASVPSGQCLNACAAPFNPMASASGQGMVMQDPMASASGQGMVMQAVTPSPVYNVVEQGHMAQPYQTPPGSATIPDTWQVDATCGYVAQGSYMGNDGAQGSYMGNAGHFEQQSRLSASAAEFKPMQSADMPQQFPTPTPRYDPSIFNRGSMDSRMQTPQYGAASLQLTATSPKRGPAEKFFGEAWDESTNSPQRLPVSQLGPEFEYNHGHRGEGKFSESHPPPVRPPPGYPATPTATSASSVGRWRNAEGQPPRHNAGEPPWDMRQEWDDPRSAPRLPPAEADGTYGLPNFPTKGKGRDENRWDQDGWEQGAWERKGNDWEHHFKGKGKDWDRGEWGKGQTHWALGGKGSEGKGKDWAAEGKGKDWGGDGKGKDWGRDGIGKDWGSDGKGKDWGSDGKGKDWAGDGKGKDWAGEGKGKDWDRSEWNDRGERWQAKTNPTDGERWQAKTNPTDAERWQGKTNPTDAERWQGKTNFTVSERGQGKTNATNSWSSGSNAWGGKDGGKTDDECLQILSNAWKDERNNQWGGKDGGKISDMRDSGKTNTTDAERWQGQTNPMFAEQWQGKSNATNSWSSGSNAWKDERSDRWGGKDAGKDGDRWDRRQDNAEQERWNAAERPRLHRRADQGSDEQDAADRHLEQKSHRRWDDSGRPPLRRPRASSSSSERSSNRGAIADEGRGLEKREPPSARPLPVSHSGFTDIRQRQQREVIIDSSDDDAPSASLHRSDLRFQDEPEESQGIRLSRRPPDTDEDGALAKSQSESMDAPPQTENGEAQLGRKPPSSVIDRGAFHRLAVGHLLGGKREPQKRVA